MKKCLSIFLALSLAGLLSGAAFANGNTERKTRISPPKLFGPTSLFTDAESHTISLDENRFFSVQAPTVEKDLPVSKADRLLNALLKDLPNDLPLGDRYKWQHISTSPGLISAYQSTFRMGYSQRFKGTRNAFYSLGLVWLRPSDTSISWNAASLSSNTANTGSSKFLSFSFQSNF
ncbi:hypothetical protein [Agaribacter flavus]|uniref:Uncharacterized protein n=1 Tax=Agaribacter flavus TaxID=1902781 RepID=A0ABV7FS79_9ALTE